MSDFIEELKWRGLIHDSTPGIQEFLNQKLIMIIYLGVHIVFIILYLLTTFDQSKFYMENIVV